MRLFKNLALCTDDSARSGPEQMALDEALLESVTRPVLRVYRWKGAAVSFGCSQSRTTVQAQYPGIPLVRRWTGGGIVEHRGDWTFSLIVPAIEPLAAWRPTETYRCIHECLAATLRGLGIAAVLVGPGDCRSGEACFTAPALHDVHDHQGQKLCGGAQRRTRRGFLHQGSVQNVSLPDDFARRFAGTMAAAFELSARDEHVQERAAILCREKYDSRPWNEKVP